MEPGYVYILSAIAIAGAVANVYGRWWCFGLWLVSSAGSCVYTATSGLWSQSAIWACFFVVNIVGLRQWRRKAHASR